jgi:molybdenum cofactor cytidylyltransferase
MGRQKLLLPFGGQPLIGHIVDQVLASRVDRTIVITGPDGERIREALGGRAVAFVVNPEGDSEMLASVRCGLRAVAAECSSVLVVLGDQPGISSGLIDALLAAQVATSCSLVMPVHEGRRGHPLLIGMVHREEILRGYEDCGLRGLLRDHADRLVEVPVESGVVLEDMDVPGDYERLMRWRP